MSNVYVPGVEHETGTTNGPLSNKQSHNIKAAISKAFPDSKITFSKGHYYCSCFVTFPNGKIAYLMTSDYRYFPQQFLIRTADHEKDYTGGVNHNYQGFENIVNAIKDLYKE
jgi:hypothetical protein